MRIEDTYNIHCFLYDITRGRFKSKWLCKHNYHNYMIRSKVENKKEVIQNGNTTITKYHKIWSPPYYKCYCCGKEVEIID